MKLLSVGVPVYNAEPYLEKCVSSILTQNYREIEVILVDDGSTDASGAICDAFAKQDARVRVIHSSNCGRMEARLAAVKHAKGDFMTFVDSDDFIQPDMYEELMRLQASYGCDVVTSGMLGYRPGEESSVSLDQVDEGFYDANQIASLILPHLIWEKGTFGMIPSLCNKIFRRNLLLQQYEQTGGTRIAYGEDILIFYPMMLTVRNIYVSHKSYYFHRAKYRENIYVRDENYFSDVYEFYARLKRVFSSHKEWPIIQRALESMYITFVGQRRRMYGQYGADMQYLFPFASVQRGARVILYGAGIVGRSFYEQIRRTHYCKLVLWVDRDYVQCQAEGFPVQIISDLENVAYDAVVIAVKAPGLQEQIRRMLMETYGINAMRIITEIC
ncbi:glycosyltransferase family 2 protein [uncultured Selenomonas sp.]|uniref:glycosyltransferase family 2 protein n=1 Tax=uncultured Selenomonas sp. TaxID=159275 RepID=UPI0025D82984|nr:glycosyltransferase family 2 protein [uncultured Selenomonas sp.]